MGMCGEFVSYGHATENMVRQMYLEMSQTLGACEKVDLQSCQETDSRAHRSVLLLNCAVPNSTGLADAAKYTYTAAQKQSPRRLSIRPTTELRCVNFHQFGGRSDAEVTCAPCPGRRLGSMNK